MTLALLFAACTTAIPQGTDADGVPDINYELTHQRDQKWESCSEPALDAALSTVIADWGLQGCAAGFAVGDEVVYLTAQGDSFQFGGRCRSSAFASASSSSANSSSAACRRIAPSVLSALLTVSAPFAYQPGIQASG